MKHVKLFEQFIVEGYYSGYDYKKWTEGNLERYREQSRPWRWNR